MIESSSGIFTGSIFNDRSILSAGHLGEARHFQDGSTILQKTHHNALYVQSYLVQKIIVNLKLEKINLIPLLET